MGRGTLTASKGTKGDKDDKRPNTISKAYNNNEKHLRADVRVIGTLPDTFKIGDRVKFQINNDNETTNAASISLNASSLAGSYECHVHDHDGNKNDYHYVTITPEGGDKLKWTNRHNVSWELSMTDDPGTLTVNSPIYPNAKTAQVTFANNGDVTSIIFQGEPYMKS